MPAIVLVEAQWGDEGKGKATDLLGDRVDYVVRYQGGNNAGHTVVIGEESYALHMLPSGVLSPHVTPVIGNGVVIDPQVLLDEIEGLQYRGIDCSKLLVSANAHLIMPYHRALDKVTERYLGSARIGTTGRGIGPAYGDKIARVGIRVQDLFDAGILGKKLDLVLREKNQILGKVYNRRGIDPQAAAAEYERYAERLRPYVADTGLVLGRALEAGQVVLLEGAQATMLDVDHGTYPFVTSSSPRRAAPAPDLASARPGSPRSSALSRPTRPASARAPSPPNSAASRANGSARRAGIRRDHGPTAPHRMVDAVVARYATRVNGITGYFLTKLDVLSGLDQVPVCVAYEVDGKYNAQIPMTQTEFHHATPVYEYLDGWSEDISKAQSFEDLPPNARADITTVEKMIGAPVCAVGVGPRPDQTPSSGRCCPNSHGCRPRFSSASAGRLTTRALSSSGWP